MHLQEKNLPIRQRSFGIDLLRIVAAFYIIVLHTMIQGGARDAAAPGSYQFFTCQALTALSYCAVNIFGLISGYVGYKDAERGYQLKSYLLLWIEVVFYGVVLTLFYMWKMPGIVTGKDLLTMFFPVTNDLYWYFTAYSALFLFIPLLNAGVRHCKKEILMPLLAVILCAAALESITGQFASNNGYSFLWLMILWLIGAIMKKYDIGQKMHPLIALLGIVLLDSAIFLLYCQGKDLMFGTVSLSLDMMDRYTCPLYLLCAMLHVILFAKLNPGSFLRKFISFSAPASFAVYIVNVQPFFWEYFMHYRFSHWAQSSVMGLLVKTAAFACLFVGTVVMTDWLRRQLFRLLQIHRLTNRLLSTTRKRKVS